jgi:hypothetical protein
MGCLREEHIGKEVEVSPGRESVMHRDLQLKKR